MQDEKTQNGTTPESIDTAILNSILSARIKPGARLGESQLAELFSVSRTRVREALMRLEARGIVHVSPKRGWYVHEPSATDAMQVYAARRVIEFGLLRHMTPLTDAQKQVLRDHLADEKHAIIEGDRQRLTFLMGDFHIRIAELAGNPILTGMLQTLTARTILISMLYQSDLQALQSHEGHCRIAEAIEREDFSAAAELSIQHLDDVETGLDLTRTPDPLADLRQSLSLPAHPSRKKRTMP
ncbi:GntR family transcriptional regulator [Allorhizobium sp. BGMRC 0089]|uniref:GntR family transcriptional regulator n=1 Tax=Allorhizobium sonneratiae TaxID=2934936 RepID=UPI0020347FC8|nr:GntR family transcriptional regulator [Allorhizobium sonneratiae]MCM2292037.1 GntR family transcriptional regulator [Allorhizobium sonneratiae]